MNNDIEQYYRLVINTLKQSISDYITSGNIDKAIALKVLHSLEFELDKHFVSGNPCCEIKALIDDMKWLIFDLIGDEQAKGL